MYEVNERTQCSNPGKKIWSLISLEKHSISGILGIPWQTTTFEPYFELLDGYYTTEG